jgi:hypothetical protein
MNDEHILMINDCEARESRLDDWSINFVDSIKRQLDGGRELTANQVEKLEEIWERATARG